jgi:hypothetical protein
MSIETPSKRILIPKYLVNQLKGLTKYPSGVNGVLFFRETERSEEFLDHVVDANYLTNFGPGVHLKMREGGREILDKFFEENPEYRGINWHTHDLTTDEKWHRRFSIEDIEFYENELARDKSFIGMMISPVHSTIYCKEDLQVNAVGNSDEFKINKGIIRSQLHDIRIRLGYKPLLRP